MLSWLSLIVKLGFVVSMMIFSGALDCRTRNRLKNSIIQGILFMFIVLIDMVVRFEITADLSFDVREIILNLSGLYYGPVTGFMTMVMTLIMRYQRSHFGLLWANVGIVLIFLFTMAFYYYLKRKNQQIKISHILALSIISNITSIATLLMTPENRSWSLMPVILIVLIGFPAATVLAAMIIDYVKLQYQLISELTASEARLMNKNHSLRETISEIKRQEMLLKKNEDMFKSIFLNSSDASLVLDNMIIIKANNESAALLGYDNVDELLNMEIGGIFLGDDERKRLSQLLVDVQNGIDVEDQEFVILNKHGIEIDVEISVSKIGFYKKDYLYLSLRDIRIRKLKEQEVIRSAQTDVLTGVYNRAYLKDYISGLTDADYPVGIIMADLNGLKLVNDFMGHSMGDSILMKSVSIMSYSVSDAGTIFRMGGDEFVILFKNSSIEYLKNAVTQLAFDLSANEEAGLEILSMSMGIALCENFHDTILNGIARADQDMYESKAKESMVFKERFIELIYNRSLKENKFKLENQSRVLELSRALAECFKLSEEKLPVLSDACKYYDLGGIYGDNYLLNSSNVELTYNLLRQIPAISDAAIYIFYLSENWDGSGKNHLKDKDIPLVSRIIRIVNDYLYEYYKKRSDGGADHDKSHMLAIKHLREKQNIYYDEKILDELESMGELIEAL